jgi:hypothetical protein
MMGRRHVNVWFIFPGFAAAQRGSLQRSRPITELSPQLDEATAQIWDGVAVADWE